MDERIDGALQWFSHVYRMENVGECAGSHSVGTLYTPWRRWIDTVNNCLKKRCLDVRQAGEMPQLYEAVEG